MPDTGIMITPEESSHSGPQIVVALPKSETTGVRNLEQICWESVGLPRYVMPDRSELTAVNLNRLLGTPEYQFWENYLEITPL